MGIGEYYICTVSIYNYSYILKTGSILFATTTNTRVYQ